MLHQLYIYYATNLPFFCPGCRHWLSINGRNPSWHRTSWGFCYPSLIATFDFLHDPLVQGRTCVRLDDKAILFNFVTTWNDGIFWILNNGRDLDTRSTGHTRFIKWSYTCTKVHHNKPLLHVIVPSIWVVKVKLMHPVTHILTS